MSESGGGDPFSQLLYPMLREQASAPTAVLEALAVAPLEKAAESEQLRRQLLEESGEAIVACARDIATSFRGGGRMLVCGNGGSATSAADLAVAFLAPSEAHRSLPALSLTGDVAVVTAIANDVSFDDVFARQVIALGRAGDVVVGVSTSGNSENLVRGLREARRRRMTTVAITGYDGGRMARESAVEHTFVVRSSSVHRIQEAQMTLYHVLVELVHRELEEESPCA